MYEPILYGWRDGTDHFWCGARDQGDVWFIKRPMANLEHPTMKPVELVERALRNSSKTRDTILDPFGGSGTTLIACEKSGRQARLIELEPRYCDVHRRWQEFTARRQHSRATEEAIAERRRSATPRWLREVARCRRELAAAETELRAGHPDVEGLCLALMDWSAELRILEGAAADAVAGRDSLKQKSRPASGAALGRAWLTSRSGTSARPPHS